MSTEIANKEAYFKNEVVTIVEIYRYFLDLREVTGCVRADKLLKVVRAESSLRSALNMNELVSTLEFLELNSFIKEVTSKETYKSHRIFT
jgi:hypothetical protein